MKKKQKKNIKIKIVRFPSYQRLKEPFSPLFKTMNQDSL
jgi:hypothetical protein